MGKEYLLQVYKLETESSQIYSKAHELSEEVVYMIALYVLDIEKS